MVYCSSVYLPVYGRYRKTYITSLVVDWCSQCFVVFDIIRTKGETTLTILMIIPPYMLRLAPFFAEKGTEILLYVLIPIVERQVRSTRYGGGGGANYRSLGMLLLLYVPREIMFNLLHEAAAVPSGDSGTDFICTMIVVLYM